MIDKVVRGASPRDASVKAVQDVLCGATRLHARDEALEIAALLLAEFLRAHQAASAYA